jgi:hypothetical protein
VVTYNVLSSSLCEEDYHVKCTPANLDPANRLRRVTKQLDDEARLAAQVPCVCMWPGASSVSVATSLWIGGHAARDS